MARFTDRKTWLAAVTCATVGMAAWAMPVTSSAQTLSPAGSSEGFTGLTPARLVDTRTAGGPVCAGQVLDVAVTGANGVPSAGVDSVVLNVTAISPSQASFLTVFPRGAARPNASNLNFTAQTTIPNLVIAKVGDSGQVSIYNHSGCVDIAADIAGWFASPAGSSEGFTGLTPARLVDTRTAGGPVCAGQVLDVAVTGANGVPSAGVDSVVLNVTAISPSQASFLTVFPRGAARPNASNLNFTAQTTIPNLVIAKVGDSGQVSIYNHSGLRRRRRRHRRLVRQPGGLV